LLAHQLIAKALTGPPTEPVGWRSTLVAALGMAIPVLVGLLTGHLETGLTLGLGAVLLASGTPAATAGQGESQSPGAFAAMLPALLAATVATALAQLPWRDAALIVVVLPAALISGYSRPVGVAAIRLIIYLVLGMGLIESAGAHGAAAAFVFGLGAVWNITVRAMIDRVSRPAAQRMPSRPQRVPTPAQRRAHWRKGLQTLSGWQFAIRLAVGLAIASMIRHSFPAHHFYWIILNVALLTQRPIEHLPAKTLQRVIGTLVGVAITWALLLAATLPWALATLVSVLAAIVPVVRARSYLLYSAISTPLILLVMDLGRPIGDGMLSDRLLATFIGAAIVLAGNALFDRLLPEQQ
jgi:hypothetical protein